MNLPELFAGLTEDKFCTGAFARDAEGNSVDFDSSRACKWCAVGWMLRRNYTWELWKVTDLAISLGFRSPSIASDAMGYPFVKMLQESSSDA